MKNIIAFFLLAITINIQAQEAIDIGTPAETPFQLGADIQGSIGNSVNEVTGKVTFSTPLTSIAAGSVSHGVGLTYNGQAAFKNGQETNKYNPTSVVGVGWSLGFPKIVVDNKNTGTRDDDVFYLSNGATNTKLICIDRGTTTNGSVWEFQAEKYAPWKISFYFHTSWGDYWKIVDETGLTYYYGNPSVNEARDHMVRYGNWIGSSKQYGATGQQTIQWNLYKMEDQWANNLVFEYEVVSQTMSGYAQTEASYLKKVISSTGASIQLTYGNKNIFEYYEPHQEISEPDAYQERYEKKYLQSVSSYNNANELVATQALGYTINGGNLNMKRYLTSITKTTYNIGLSETFPAQEFDYHYIDNFKGGLKKITYPTGGSVTYNYSNKLLFNNTYNLFDTTLATPSGYTYYSTFVSDNYNLQIFRTTNAISGSNYRFKIYRVWWNGEKWKHHEFTFPHLLNIDTSNVNNHLKDLDIVLKEDFYGFAYDKGTTADVYLFHLNKDGRTWHEYSTSRTIGSENSSFVAGNDFAALQSHRGGELYTFVWNGSYWNNKTINQGAGQYYIAATNNYIISLDEDGGYDMGTTTSYSDNYYMHYLDAEKKWQTKLWSVAVDPYIASIEDPSYFYPDNSIIGFMADDNPELFLRWDTNYNLTNVDNVLGGYSDTEPMAPIANGMFTIYNSWYKYPRKSARFNGVNWSVSALPSSGSYYAKPEFGEDLLMFQGHSSISGVGYHEYDPNFNSWAYYSLYTYPWYMGLSRLSAINREFVVAGNYFYKKSNQGIPTLPYIQIGSLQYDNEYSKSNGLSHTFVKQAVYVDNGGSATTTLKDGVLFYINKKTGLLESTNLGSKSRLKSESYRIGGVEPFFSPKAVWLQLDNNSTVRYLYRIIDDQINNNIYDIVVNHIDINDDNGTQRKVQYTFNNPKSTPDNSATFYGEVIIENKGVGVGNIGKVVKIFNDGSDDLRMVGLPLEIQTIDANNALVKKTNLTWKLTTKSAYNGSNYVDQSYYIRQSANKEELYFNNSPNVTSQTTNIYNSNGFKTSSTSTNSKGKSVVENISYAADQYNYSFVKDKNMLVFPYQTTLKINNQYVSVEQSKWINDGGKAYINENWSGASTSLLRLNSQISKVESTTGNVLESNNGKGIYNSVLFGYNNLYEVATISNATYQEVIDELDVSYLQLQGLSTANLKVELLKLYDRLPNAGISLSFYDNNGRVTSSINGRKEESFVYYDTGGRLDHISDSQSNILEKRIYKFNGQEEIVILPTYSISKTTNGNGVVTLSSTSVGDGGSVSVTITPNSGYEITSIKVNGLPQTINTFFSINNITSNTVIDVEFSLITATAFTVSPVSLIFEQIDGNKTITVTASGSWTVSTPQTWLIITGTSGSGNGTFTIRPLKNFTGPDRSGNVTVINGIESQTISVTQLFGGPDM
ncbi:hypothetical protein EC396_14410 [Lutibacter sp. HS1-25]|uniref:InlB B-repeat-containing protein n=1 Tax=Lutibacter sp. HS1-25 TaxID=2485000 RepID=UPI0010122A16|nr:BACON domain-containing carbohydrate-binding protein [Lutibacter sp. HS1-25]RXP46199.1 hypothetical protein EC396_14410 [Lutibacter sp. HS1-25]